MRSNLPIIIALALGVGLIFTGAMMKRDRGNLNAPATRASLDEACAEDDGRACYELGLMWGNGVDGSADAERARHFVSRACDLEHTAACDFLPMMR